jgi:excisionase family DNA binding protein
MTTTTKPLTFDRALTIRETAQALGVSYATVHRLLVEGRIEHQRVSPRRTVVRESAVLDYLDSTTIAQVGESANCVQRREPRDRCVCGCHS